MKIINTVLTHGFFGINAVIHDRGTQVKPPIVNPVAADNIMA